MTKYIATTALSIQVDPEKRPWRTRLYRLGDVVELEGDAAKSLLDRKGIREPEKGELEQDEDTEPSLTSTATIDAPSLPVARGRVAGEAPPAPAGGTTTPPGSTEGTPDEEETPEPEEIELPQRPSNGASKDAWRTYLGELNAVTRDELGELEVPADANRDRMIEIGDARVAAWNEEG